MAITIEWETKIISIPKADLELIQSVPTEIRELNIDTFRLVLRGLEDSEVAIPFLRTHDHFFPVDVGGVTLARVVRIVNDYTVTFEDGQYAVNIVGGNSNIGDNVNVNQVSVRSANSAGLISNEAIEFSSFNEGVTVDVMSGFAGTTFPVGTLQAPVNNLNDALLIAEVRGFNKLFIIGDFTFTTTDDISYYSVYGNHIATTFTFDAPVCVNTEFHRATLTGTLDGGNQKIRDCEIENLTNFSGVIRDSVLRGNLILDGTETIDILNCFSGVPGTGTPEIDMGGSGRGLAMRAYSGGIKITNLTGAENVSVDFISGQLKLGVDITAGTFAVRGAGIISEDLSTGTTIVDSGLINPGVVWDVTMADHLTDGTTGKKLYDGGTGDTAAIAAAVWDELLSEHDIVGSAGEALYIAGRMAPEGGWMSSSTAAEIKLVRDKLGDAGNLIAETIIDEEAIASNTTTVFTMYHMIYEVNGVWLLTDIGHTGTNYFDGDNGTFDTHTGMITLHTILPSDNENVLISYTYFKGLHDDVITQFLTEAKMFVKKYTRKSYDWTLAFADPPDEETQIALWTATALAAKRCLEALAAGDILQLGFNFRLGDLEIENMVRGGGFQVQAHIDMLNEDVNNKLAMLGRGMYFSTSSTKLFGRDHWGYKRTGTTRRSDIQ